MDYPQKSSEGYYGLLENTLKNQKNFIFMQRLRSPKIRSTLLRTTGGNPLFSMVFTIYVVHVSPMKHFTSEKTLENF